MGHLESPPFPEAWFSPKRPTPSFQILRPQTLEYALTLFFLLPPSALICCPTFFMHRESDCFRLPPSLPGISHHGCSPGLPQQPACRSPCPPLLLLLWALLKKTEQNLLVAPSRQRSSSSSSSSLAFQLGLSALCLLPSPLHPRQLLALKYQMYSCPRAFALVVLPGYRMLSSRVLLTSCSSPLSTGLTCHLLRGCLVFSLLESRRSTRAGVLFIFCLAVSSEPRTVPGT